MTDSEQAWLDSHDEIRVGIVNNGPPLGMVDEDGIDLNVPLVGYAIGIPPIDPDPGGTYVKGDYDITDDDEETVEDEDDEVPSDYKE